MLTASRVMESMPLLSWPQHVGQRKPESLPRGNLLRSVFRLHSTELCCRYRINVRDSGRQIISLQETRRCTALFWLGSLCELKHLL